MDKYLNFTKRPDCIFHFITNAYYILRFQQKMFSGPNNSSKALQDLAVHSTTYSSQTQSNKKASHHLLSLTSLENMRSGLAAKVMLPYKWIYDMMLNSDLLTQVALTVQQRKEQLPLSNLHLLTQSYNCRILTYLSTNLTKALNITFQENIQKAKVQSNGKVQR